MRTAAQDDVHPPLLTLLEILFRSFNPSCGRFVYDQWTGSNVSFFCDGEIPNGGFVSDRILVVLKILCSMQR